VILQTSFVGLLLDSMINKRKAAKRLLDFLDVHPEEERSTFDKHFFSSRVSDLDARIKSRKTQHPNANPDLDLATMAKEVDSHPEISNYKGPTMEFLYALTYWRLSDRVHASLNSSIQYLNAATQTRDMSGLGTGEEKNVYGTGEMTRLLCQSAIRFVEEKLSESNCLKTSYELSGS